MGDVTGPPTDHQPGAGQSDDLVSLIEPTTGAPLGAVPQRVPVRVPPESPVPIRGTGPGHDEGLRGQGERRLLRAATPEQTPADEPAFWLPIEEVHWDGTPVRKDPKARFGWLRFRREPGRRTDRSPRPPRPPRHAVTGLAGLLSLTLLTSFFAWVSAEPLWLAVGRGEYGTVVVTGCTGNGVKLRCRGTFVAANAAFTVVDVALAGVGPGSRQAGSRVTARMLDADARMAYAEGGAVLGHLRWLLGLMLVLLCAGGIVWSTGALRLPEPRARLVAVLVGLAGPLIITVGFIAAAA
ncbi:hypothetical protein GCM10027290_21470 [Micromonospora sonneratiae]|uniref:Uncharacterized protein n=1 Tax=Micromonospora sonneratiae TaxID=1184706 RepID=A0ABW3YFS5_9ACTN